MEEMKKGVLRFHEQAAEAKKEFYTRDLGKKVVYLSNFDLYSGSLTNWRDSFSAFMAPNPPNPEELPSVIRFSTVFDYFLNLKKRGQVS